MTQDQVWDKVEGYIREFTAMYPAQVVYLAYSGSRLYGTYTPTSDYDVKGIFIPSAESLKLKTDIPHYTRTTGDSHSSNGEDDIDFTLISIHNFIAQLSKSETGAIEILYSMFSPEAIIFQNKDFTSIMKDHRLIFQTKEISSFIGYALGQTKKFNYKGLRYAELVKFIAYFEQELMSPEVEFIGAHFDTMNVDLKKHFNYISIVTDRGPKIADNTYKEIQYLHILGKKYAGSTKSELFFKLIKDLEASYGARTRTTAKSGKGDWKALSHAYRISKQIDELVNTGEIQFPLSYSNEIMAIKQGEVDFQEILGQIEDNITIVRQVVKYSDKPRTVTPSEVHSLILELLEVR